MRVAALYDIHGNLPALEAVLDEVRRAGVGRVVVGGDVLPGPMPRECLARLRELDVPVRCIHGNGESAVLAQRAGREPDSLPEHVREIIRWVAGEVDEWEAWLTEWPSTVRLPIPGLGDVLFCHATPRNDTEVFTRLTPDDRLLPVFEGVDEALVVCGHTHMQHDRMVGGVRIVNAGSVGMPFGDPGAFWLLLGPGVQFRRTPYDLTRAAERIRNTDYPQADEFANRDVLHPRSEEEALEVLAKAELR